VWGSNLQFSPTVFGQLGDNTGVSKSSPVLTVAFGTNWKQVSCGYYFTAAIKTDGTLWCWGGNNNGQLGDNTGVRKSSPVQTVAFGTNWKQVSCGYDHAAAIKSDGTLWSWGSNGLGNLGDNTSVKKSSPVQTISYGTNWKQIKCSKNNSFAIKTDGTLWCWGVNSVGELGDNTQANRSSPIQTITAGSNWKDISASNSTTAAIKTDGTLWVWGYNNLGQLGDNTITNKSSPVQTITRGTNWKQVSGGTNHTAAVKTDGTLWTWGYNFYGQLGDNTTTNKSSPVQTMSGGNNWKIVSAFEYGGTTAAIQYQDDYQ
jgi:alpha-tubulin suppressor-like RCC1 family protein